jgi:hypothetical protein
MKNNATTKNILRALESQNPIRVTHPIVGTLTIDDAKPLGFGTKSVMVKMWHSNGWTTICPLTWTILP